MRGISIPYDANAFILSVLSRTTSDVSTYERYINTAAA